jgi:hypothetical protein
MLKRTLITIVTALSLGVATIPRTDAASPAWPNEPAGFTTLIDWPFNTVTGGGWNQNTGAASIVSDSTAPLSPSNVMEMAYPIGFRDGSAPDTVWRGLGVNEMFVGFWWKPSNPWQDDPSGNKIAFLDIIVHTFVIMMPVQHEIWIQLDFGADNSHLPNSSGVVGPTNVWGNRVTVSLGQWHRIEIHVKNSTTALSRDGILRWWIDGVNAGNYTNVNYLGLSQPFVEFQFSPTWGGNSGAVKTEQDYFRYDHLRISVPGGPVIPPVAPSNAAVH